MIIKKKELMFFWQRKAIDSNAEKLDIMLEIAKIMAKQHTAVKNGESQHVAEPVSNKRTRCWSIL